MSTSGYTHCACRDCFDIAISDHGELALCLDCQAAGCEPYPGEEDAQRGVNYDCQREDAYTSESEDD